MMMQKGQKILLKQLVMVFALSLKCCSFVGVFLFARYGHFARECTQEENSCYKCSESGHLAKECEKPDICYVCNKEGHMAKDCPDGDQKTCYKCGGKGHIALECPSQEAIPRAKR